MKKIDRYLLLTLILSLGLLVSCKKKYESDQVGPEIILDFNLVSPFRASVDRIKFDDNDTNKVFFAAKMDRKVRWKILIVGETSGATKTFTGLSDVIDSSMAKWDGGQDSLYFFRNGERCFISLSAINDITVNSLTNQLDTRGVLIKQETPIFYDTLIIERKKALPITTLDLMPTYVTNHYVVGFDDENHNNQYEYLPPISRTSAGAYTGVVQNTPLPNSLNGQGIRGANYFLLRGLDKDDGRGDSTENLANYYIGRIATTNLLGDIPSQRYYNQRQTLELLRSGQYGPDDIYINVFVYGNNDGSKINVALKEDEGGKDKNYPDRDENFDEGGDEFFQKTIIINFTGWKLFSFKYSEFSYKKHPPKNIGDEEFEGYWRNKITEPTKLIQVQFGLVAPSIGKVGQFIIDMPTLTFGAPFKY